MHEQALIEYLPGIILAITFIVVLGMWFTYRILRLLLTKGERDLKTKQKAFSKGQPYKDADFNQLIDRCTQLSQRVATLEEIIREK